MASQLDKLVARGVISEDSAAAQQARDMAAQRLKGRQQARPRDIPTSHQTWGNLAEAAAKGFPQPPEDIRQLPKWIGDNPDVIANMAMGMTTGPVEKIAGAAFLHDGKIYSGPNHTIALDQARNAGVPGTDIIKNGKEGFVTDSGRFVDRKQAVDIANAAEQWRGPIKPSDEELAYAREKGITREALKPLSEGRNGQTQSQ